MTHCQLNAQFAVRQDNEFLDTELLQNAPAAPFPNHKRPSEVRDNGLAADVMTRSLIRIASKVRKTS